HCSPDVRGLHSSPTRRSSDLTMTARVGFSVLLQLAAYVGVVLLGLGLHLFGVYSLLLWGLASRSPLAFFRGIRLALATAFSTARSEEHTSELQSRENLVCRLL